MRRAIATERGCYVAMKEAVARGQDLNGMTTVEAATLLDLPDPTSRRTRGLLARQLIIFGYQMQRTMLHHGETGPGRRCEWYLCE